MASCTENILTHKLFAFNIVKSLAKKFFSQSREMALLIRSDSFLNELLNMCNNLYYLDITPQKIFDAVNNTDLFEPDKYRMVLVAQLYEAYTKIMSENSYKFPYPENSVCHKNIQALNNDIQQRLDFLRDVFLDKKLIIPNFSKSESISYLEFSDVQQEALYIAKEIKDIVAKNLAEYRDIAIFADKTETREKLEDVLKASDIPVASRIYDENYENLKHKISLYRGISDVCLQLNMREFSYDAFKNICLNSKAQTEIYKNELDILINDLLSEVLTDSYAVEKILNTKNNSAGKKFLPDVIHMSWHILSDKDSSLLALELNSVKVFYDFYVSNNFAMAIESVIKRFLVKFDDSFMKGIVAGKIKSLNNLQNLYDNILKCSADFASFEDIMSGLPNDETKDKDAVRISSFHSNIKSNQDFKYVFAAGLTENNFPGVNHSYPFISEKSDRILTDVLQSVVPEFSGFVNTDESYFLSRFGFLCDVISKAENKIIFAYHSYEAKKPALPSVFFKTLKDNDIDNFSVVKIDENIVSNFCTSDCGNNDKIESCNVIDCSDILKLNPSAISTFQKCPRKYYYKNLLNLKEPYTFSAGYGTIVHAVFEVLNTKYLDSYKEGTALELADVLFKSKQGDDYAARAVSVGFKESDIELISECDELSLAEMKANFADAISDFSLSGGFDFPPIRAVCEKSFTFKLNELPNIEFSGRIDAILTYKDGTVKVIDYKTGRNKVNSLEYAISEYGVNFKSRTGKNPSKIETLQNSYDYQIPLYYFAVQNSPDFVEFKDKISSLGLMYIRPKSKDGGCCEDFVSAQNIEYFKDKILQNLKETIIDKISCETKFKQNRTFVCDTCAYKFLCDGGIDDD